MWLLRSSKITTPAASSTTPADAATPPEAGTASSPANTATTAPAPIITEVKEINEADLMDPSEEFEFITGKKELQRLENEIKDKSDAIANLDADLKAQITKFQNADKLHKSELQYRDKLVMEAEAKTSEYLRQMQPLKRDLEIRETALKEKSKAVEELSVQCAKYKAELQGLQGDVERARARANELSQQNQQQADGFQKTIDVKTKEITELTSRIVTLEGQLDDLKRANRDQAIQIEAMKSLKEQCKEGSQQLMDQSIQLKASQQKTKDLETENKQLRDEVGRLKQTQLKEKSDREKTVGDLSRQVDRLSENAKSLKSQLEQAHSDLQKANTQVTTMSKELADRNAELNHVKTKLAQAETQLNADNQNRADENKKHILDKEGLSVQVSKAENENVLLRQQLEDAKRREADQAKTIGHLRADLAVQYERISTMQQNIEEITAQVDTTPQSEMQATARTMAKHRAQIQRIVGENPNCVPVRCLRAENCKTLPLLETTKFAALKDMALPRFTEHIRAKLNLAADKPLFVVVELESGQQLPCTQILGDLYQACKSSDGYLHLRYSHLNA